MSKKLRRKTWRQQKKTNMKYTRQAALMATLFAMKVDIDWTRNWRQTCVRELLAGTV